MSTKLASQMIPVAPAAASFDPDCGRCPRLVDHLDAVRTAYPAYHARPVPPFGDANARLLIVGLAPGMHGANATGRPFTGDFAGILLYRTLHRFGFASAPEARGPDDGLVLTGCRITNAVKCLPPENKPIGEEVTRCNDFLRAELSALAADSIILALGGIAHRAVLKAQGLRQNRFGFAHGAVHELPGGLCLVDSYHCSRYNTQTRRLTEDMFEDVFRRIVDLLGYPPA